MRYKIRCKRCECKTLALFHEQRTDIDPKAPGQASLAKGHEASTR